MVKDRHWPMLNRKSAKKQKEVQKIANLIRFSNLKIRLRLVRGRVEHPRYIREAEICNKNLRKGFVIRLSNMGKVRMVTVLKRDVTILLRMKTGL